MKYAFITETKKSLLEGLDIDKVFVVDEELDCRPQLTKLMSVVEKGDTVAVSTYEDVFGNNIAFDDFLTKMLEWNVTIYFLEAQLDSNSYEGKGIISAVRTLANIEHKRANELKRWAEEMMAQVQAGKKNPPEE